MYRVWTNKSGLKPPRFIEVPVLIQVNEWLCICVLKVSSLPLCKVFLLNLGNVPTLWYLLSGFGNKKNDHYALQTNICKSSHFFGKQQTKIKYKLSVAAYFCRLVLCKVLANHDMHFIVRFPVPEHLVV